MEATEQKIIDIIKEYAWLDELPEEDKIKPFKSLGIDSLHKLEITFEIEKAFSIKVPDDDFEEWKNIDDMLRGTLKLLGK